MNKQKIMKIFNSVLNLFEYELVEKQNMRPCFQITYDPSSLSVNRVETPAFQAGRFNLE